MSILLEKMDELFITFASGTAFNTTMVTGNLDDSGSFNNIATSVEKGGNSVIYILLLAAAFLGAIGLIISFIMIMAGGSQAVSAGKSNLLWKVIAIIGAFASVGSIAVLHSIGSGLFSGASTPTPAGGFIMPMLPFLQTFF